MEGNVNTKYQRVAPRDLFNEANLLKSLGRLALLILDAGVTGLTYTSSGRPFVIGLHDAGYLTATAGITIKRGRQKLWLGTTYNCRSPYALICYDEQEGEIPVFEENGELTDEFRAYAAR